MGSLLMTVFNAGQREPPLPLVQLSVERPQQAATLVQGRLLSHSNGYWYLFNESDGRLVAIPNESAKEVTVVPRRRIPQATPSPPGAGTPQSGP